VQKINYSFFLLFYQENLITQYQMQASGMQAQNPAVFNAYGMPVGPGQGAFNNAAPGGMMPNGMMPSPNGMMQSPMPSGGNPNSLASLLPTAPGNMGAVNGMMPGMGMPGMGMPGMGMPGMMPNGAMSGFAMQGGGMMQGNMQGGGMMPGNMQGGGMLPGPPPAAVSWPPAPPQQSGPDASFLSLLGMDSAKS